LEYNAPQITANAITGLLFEDAAADDVVELEVGGLMVGVLGGQKGKFWVSGETSQTLRLSNPRYIASLSGLFQVAVNWILTGSLLEVLMSKFEVVYQGSTHNPPILAQL